MNSRLLVAAVAAVMSTGCGSTAPSSPSADSATPFVTEHFTFVAATADSALAQQYAASLEQEFTRITSDLDVASMPRVNIHLYGTHSQLEAAVAPLVGSIPVWASGLVTATDQIHVVARIGAVNLVHEFAHCVSMRINPRIPNNPRWFWEALAIYEAGQAVDPKVLPYMTAATPPSLAALNGFDNTLIYDVGYTIGEFIAARGGRAAMRALVANSADVQTTLGLSLPEFERAWFAFTRQKYGF